MCICLWILSPSHIMSQVEHIITDTGLSSHQHHGSSLFILWFYFAVDVLTGRWALLRRKCLFQHWLTTTPIIAALTPNYSSHLRFVLWAKYRYHRVLCLAEQLFRKIDGDNPIATCHQLFLTSAVNINYVLRIITVGDVLGHLLHLPCQVQFFLEWWEMQIPRAQRSDRSPLLRPVGIFYTCHLRLLTSLLKVCFSTLSNPLPVIVEELMAMLRAYNPACPHHFEV